MALYECHIIIIVVLLQFSNVYLFVDDAKLYRHILSDEDHYTLSSLVYVPYKNGQINGFLS